MHITQMLCGNVLRVMGLLRKNAPCVESGWCGGRLMVGNDWSEKYDEITNEMPVNDAEKRVLQMLQKGSTILEAREANGLSDVEMGNLMERAKKAEIEKLCVSVPKDE